MRILLIADPNSFYIYSFVKNTLLENKKNDIVIFNRVGKINNEQKEYYQFYAQNNITVASIEFSSGVDAYDMAKSSLLLQTFGEFDVCHIHYLDPLACYLGMAAVSRCKVLIANYWGSDWYRGGFHNRQLQFIVNKIADFIVADSESLLNNLNEYYNGQFRNKSRYIKFKLPIVSEVDTITDNEIKAFESSNNIPADKIKIVCGYNANQAHQHTKMLDSIKRLPDTYKKRICVLLPFTYGKDPNYIKMIKQILTELGCEAILLEKYLNVRDVAVLRIVTDIFINFQITDACASTVMEYLYCNKLIINGTWLDYHILKEHGAFMYSVKGKEQLLELLIKLLDAPKEYLIQKNKDVLRTAQFIYDDNKNWEMLYNSALCVDKVKNITYETMEAFDKVLDVYQDILKQRAYIYKKLSVVKSIADTHDVWKDYANIYVYGVGELAAVLRSKMSLKNKRLFFIDKYKDIDTFGMKESIYKLDELQYMNGGLCIITPLLDWEQIQEELSEINSKIVCISAYDFICKI